MMVVSKDYHIWAECHDPERAKLWRRIRPDGRLPLRDPWPVIGKWEGEEFLAYVVDPDQLTPEEKKRATQVLAEVHGLSLEETRQYVEQGLLVKAKDVSVIMDQVGVAVALSMADMTGEWDDIWEEEYWEEYDEEEEWEEEEW